MRRFMPTLLLALPFVVALAPAAADSTRTIGVALSRFVCPPETIKVKDGQKVRPGTADEALPRQRDHAKPDCTFNCGRQ
jgi:hypothetical protein